MQMSELLNIRLAWIELIRILGCLSMKHSMIVSNTAIYVNGLA